MRNIKVFEKELKSIKIVDDLKVNNDLKKGVL